MVKESIKKNLEDFLQQYGKNNVTTRFMDDTQQSFKCCGVYGPKDYLEMSKSVIPESCCEKSSDDATKCDVNTAFQEGCYEQLKQAFIDNLKILKFVGLFVIVFQALSVLISFCLANNIRRAYDVV